MHDVSKPQPSITADQLPEESRIGDSPSTSSEGQQGDDPPPEKDHRGIPPSIPRPPATDFAPTK